MNQRLKPHDPVAWQTPQGETHGQVTRVIKHATTVRGRHVAASPEAPSYEVQSAKSGKHAVHRASALHKRSGR
ncbi:hypervirulence associated TUDOR domain-containing protein [Chitinasiproducens palmae]|uniref:Hypervirulence associated protein TUDOR domain-containing protein n=1 Tax=Chitinasiproducens palmae TaxID=1770053 RepID=A0A1H2PXA9_9BURK|nr:DUF2945 domain-containing protein [Chitinasiproducens palmae]SDV51251.1 Protein of unknown function [Chitinasiproducens palmae]